MAGSWDHMTTEDGKLRSVESFHQMMDTGGDVYEAAEECFGMIWWMAGQIDHLIAEGHPVKGTRDDLMLIIATARHNYQKGLGQGGVQTEDEAAAELARDGS